MLDMKGRRLEVGDPVLVSTVNPQFGSPQIEEGTVGNFVDTRARVDLEDGRTAMVWSGQLVLDKSGGGVKRQAPPAAPTLFHNARLEQQYGDTILVPV